MFHTSSVLMSNRHGRTIGFRSFMPTTSFNRPDYKEPFRRGILFASVAFVLLLIGVMLTWLGLKEPFSDKISMTGPLLIVIALLVLLLSLRPLMLARKRNRAINGTVQMDTISTGGVTAVVVDDEDGNRATVVVEASDTEEPLREEIRNPGELAPPAYIDISQSCSSMCPSFVSHEDHNEAPPTYEETCRGIYLSGSENTLSQRASRNNTFQSSHHSSLLPNPPAYALTQQMSDIEHDGVEEWRRMRESQCSSILSPANSGALMAQAAVRRQRQTLPPLTLHDNCDQHSMIPTASSSIINVLENAGANACIRSPSPENLSLSSYMQSPNSGRLATTAPPTPVPPGVKQMGKDDIQNWSRRSFSSIPSYTCLLSKSGEVSAQVFDTSSIIQGMMPHSVHVSDIEGQGEQNARTRESLGATVDASGIENLLPAHSSVPARSHSLSSVLPLRLGVPYNTHPAQEESMSPNRSLIISSPLLSSPQHCPDVIQQYHPQQLEQHQYISSNAHTHMNSSLSLASPASDVQLLSQSHIKSSDQKESDKCLKQQSNKFRSNGSIDLSEVCIGAQTSVRCTTGVDPDEEKLSEKGCSPVKSPQDIQETI